MNVDCSYRKTTFSEFDFIFFGATSDTFTGLEWSLGTKIVSL